MAEKTYNGVPVADILRTYDSFVDKGLEVNPDRVKKTIDLAITPYNPEWLARFQTLKARILAAFEPSSTAKYSTAPPVTVIEVNHVGSTSVPGLAAKDVIDIDLVLSDVSRAAEMTYVPRLAAAGFEFRLREPGWNEHRFFRGWEPISCNLHVWGPRCSEVERHRIFRDWLAEHDDDRDWYGRVKQECAQAAVQNGENMEQYTQRKDWVIEEIRQKAFKSLGFLD